MPSENDSASLSDWDPTKMVKSLYEISYEPRIETKHNQFISMEGHVEVPADEVTKADGLDNDGWVKQYIRTREGRLQIFAAHYAGEAPDQEFGLSGATVEFSKEDRTITINGGSENVKYFCRVPSALFDKWRLSFLSHSKSNPIDVFVKPIPRAHQHLNKHVMILDIGLCSIRAGLLTTEPTLPQSFFPALGVRKADGTIQVGLDIFSPEKRQEGTYLRPILLKGNEYEVEKDVMKGCINKVINDLKINPSKYKVLLVLPQRVSNKVSADLIQILLEEYKFQGATMTKEPSMVLYSYDATTGVVVNIGDQLDIVPIINGYVYESAIFSTHHGSQTMSEALKQLLPNNIKENMDSPVGNLLLRYIMENATYIPEDYQNEKNGKNSEVRLDGFDLNSNSLKRIDIGKSGYQCTEGWFNPQKWGIDMKAIHTLIHDAIQLCPIDSKKTLYKNVFLSGGASLIPGFASKIEKELSKIAPNNAETHVTSSPWRYNSSYIGAEVVALTPTFDDAYVNLKNLDMFIKQLTTDTLENNTE